jgi:indole-3-acetate monooxygenase
MSENARTPASAARALRPLILSAREETENARALSPRVTRALLESNLFRLAVPAVHGGLEASPLEALDVYEELAGAEASAAFVVWNNSLPALLSRFLADDVRHALFGDPATITANSTRPSGRALRAAGGYRVSGQWALVSGCELAEHMLLRCIVAPDAGQPGSGPPELIMAHVPKHGCRIVDTWRAGGLRGTGSHDVIVQDAFVPNERCISFTQPSRLQAPLYRMPFAATLSAGCAAICLGIAQAALLTLVDLATTKPQADFVPRLRDRPALQAEIAKLVSQQAAARLLLRSTVDAAWQACLASRPVTLVERAAIWSAAQHASDAAKDLVRRAYDAAGTSALYVSCPLERGHRDIHAVTQHIILSQAWLEDAGRVWLALEPGNPMFAS